MLDKKHRNTLIVSMVWLLLSSFYFFSGIQFQEKGVVPDIGEVFEKNNDLRRKIDGSLSWVGIESTTKIFPGDKVFTGTSSLAQLNIFDQAQIKMDSSTLLKIDPNASDGMSLQGGLGFFTTKLTAKSKKTTIKLRNSTFELNGAGSEIQVNALEDKTIVSALGGKVAYRTLDPTGKTGTHVLAPNQLLGMNRAGESTVVNLAVQLIAPANSEEVLTAPAVPIRLTWKTLIQGVPLSLELSKTPSFEEVFLKKDVTGLNEAQIPIDSNIQGAVYWRIVEPGKEKYFYSQRFDYHPLTPPVIFVPVQHHGYPIATAIGPEISWEKKFDFTYEGEIQQLDGGISGAQKFSGPNPSYLAKNMTKGHYQVRIRAKKNKLFTEWTAWREFSIGNVVQTGIELISPVESATATFNLPQKEVTFQWSGGGAESQSQIEIATDENFKAITFKGITDKNTINWRPGAQGKYFWRVKSSFSSVISKYRSLMIVEPKLALLTPKDKIAYVYRDQGFQNIIFTWEDASLDDQYTFETSSTPDFKKVNEHVLLKKPGHELNVSKRNDVVYWHVLTKNQTSETRVFRLSRAIEAAPVVESNAPTLGMLVVKIREDNTVFGGTAPRKTAGTDFVEIFLPQVEKAASYQVQIMRDPNGKNMVINKTLTSTIFRWNNPVAGEYFWRIYYRDQNGNKSAQSASAKLVIEPKEGEVVKVKPVNKVKSEPTENSFSY